MERSTARVCPALVLAAAVAVPFAPTSAADAPTTTAAATAPTAASVSSAPATGQAPAESAATPARSVFCLKTTLQCFATKADAKNAPSLNLHAPDIGTIVSQAELEKPLPDPYDPYEESEQQATVQIEGTRPDIEVPGGLASLWWAVKNPTQAWRILLPVPSSQTK